MRSKYLRPAAWFPVLALIVVAGWLAEVVQPWPEGRVLYTPRGLGPHGITSSDAIVLAAVVAGTVAWLCYWSITNRPESRVAPSTGAPSDAREGSAP